MKVVNRTEVIERMAKRAYDFNRRPLTDPEWEDLPNFASINVHDPRVSELDRFHYRGLAEVMLEAAGL